MKVDLQPDEGVPIHVRDYLAKEREQAAGRRKRVLGRLGEALVNALADEGGAFHGRPLPCHEVKP